MKDDSGSYAVFTEQGSSASQMTAAEVMDIISRLPGCAGQAADAVSACTLAKNGRCSKIFENSQIWNAQTFGFVYHDANGPKSWSSMEDPVVPLESEICTVILWEDCYGKGTLRKSF